MSGLKKNTPSESINAAAGLGFSMGYALFAIKPASTKKADASKHSTSSHPKTTIGAFALAFSAGYNLFGDKDAHKNTAVAPTK